MSCFFIDGEIRLQWFNYLFLCVPYAHVIFFKPLPGVCRVNAGIEQRYRERLNYELWKSVAVVHCSIMLIQFNEVLYGLNYWMSMTLLKYIPDTDSLSLHFVFFFPSHGIEGNRVYIFKGKICIKMFTNQKSPRKHTGSLRYYICFIKC